MWRTVAVLIFAGRSLVGCASPCETLETKMQACIKEAGETNAPIIQMIWDKQKEELASNSAQCETSLDTLRQGARSLIEFCPSVKW